MISRRALIYFDLAWMIYAKYFLSLGLGVDYNKFLASSLQYVLICKTLIHFNRASRSLMYLSLEIFGILTTTLGEGY